MLNKIVRVRAHVRLLGRRPPPGDCWGGFAPPKFQELEGVEMPVRSKGGRLLGFVAPKGKEIIEMKLMYASLFVDMFG